MRRLVYRAAFLVGAIEGYVAERRAEQDRLTGRLGRRAQDAARLRPEFVPTARATMPNADCEVCGGTGTDPVFFGDCSECWPDEPQRSVARHLARSREAMWEARRQQSILNRTPH